MAFDSSRHLFRGLTAVLALVVGASLAVYWVDFDGEDPKARRSGPFLATPYLQLGAVAPPDALTVVWHADDVDADWRVEVQAPVGSAWRAGGKPESRSVVLENVEPQRVYWSVLSRLVPGSAFRYRVKRQGAVAFEAEGKAKPAPGRPQRFVAFGDCAAGTPGQKQVAFQTFQAKPDYVLLTGDIVYFRGRIGEYRSKFFPIYAAPVASPDLGAPLLGSTLFVGVPGNHDIALDDFDRDADLMAYFLFWSQPLNGPTEATSGKLAPPVDGSPGRVEAFREAAGANYPRMANFSFDAGDVHWTILDSNPYIQWADPKLRAWVAADLAAHAARPWRFVAFHHPGFHSSKAHAGEQQMRLLADLFEQGGVALVFSGHIHNYQRTFPLRFTARTYPDGHAPRPSRPVDGTWTLDKTFDGSTRTEPDGVIYLTTGAGGAKLYDVDQPRHPETWKPFTTRFVADVHSLTQVDVTPDAVNVRQISGEGVTLDAFTVTRPK